MKRGAWHQCGDRSQKLVVEQLTAGHGVGVILSPRDLSDMAVKYAAQYIEGQRFSLTHNSTFPISAMTISTLTD